LSVAWAVAKFLGVLCLAFLCMALASGVAVATTPSYTFPRLGMWLPSYTQPLADRARYDWIVDNSGPIASAQIGGLRAANPDIVLLAYTSARNINYSFTDYNIRANVELRTASLDWVLTQVGSRLAANVSAAALAIPVTDGTKFVAGEVIVFDSGSNAELLRIASVVGNTLNVTGRGIPFSGTAHSAGARVAAAVSTNPEWSNVVFDVTTACPLRDVGYGPETFTSWNVRRASSVYHSADSIGQRWDGLLMDNCCSSISWMVPQGRLRSIDEDRDNVADDLTDLDTTWNNGVVAYENELRAALPEAVLLGNCGVRNYNLNGNNLESYIDGTSTLASWKQHIIGPEYPPTITSSYLDWSANASAPNLTTVEMYGTQTDYQFMRYGLCTTLMGDGCYSYESVSGHGGANLWWYDEYDNAGAGRGYLGQPTGAAYSAGSNVWRRDFAGGTVLVNPDTVAHNVELGGLFRKIKGTQAPAINTGGLVTDVTLQPRDGIVLLSTEPSVPSSYEPRPVHRFRNPKTGYYLWSANESEKAAIIATLWRTWTYEGVAYVLNTANSHNSSSLWRFRNVEDGRYLYTANLDEKANVIAHFSSTWQLEGEAYRVSTDGSGDPVWRFRNLKNGSYLYSADLAEKNAIVSTLKSTWVLEGVAYYLAP